MLINSCGKVLITISSKTFFNYKEIKISVNNYEHNIHYKKITIYQSIVNIKTI